MSKIVDRIYLAGTYLVALFNMVITFELIKSIIIFLATMFLLVIQIKIHLKRLRKEDNNDDLDVPKKN
jgi:hypothetical protein